MAKAASQAKSTRDKATSKKATKSGTKNWYAVRSFYSHTIAGKTPVKKVSKKAPAVLEERVVLFQAKSIDEALNLAEADSDDYCLESMHENPFGEIVQCQPEGGLECFWMFESPASGVEAFSSMKVFGEQREVKKIAKSLDVPEKLTKRESALRERFAHKS